MYISYIAALEMCGLQTLYMCREQRSLQFALKCTRHIINKHMFPLNRSSDTHNVRNREMFHVNKTHTETYYKSAIPYLQRRLNDYYDMNGRLGENRRRAARAGGM